MDRAFDFPVSWAHNKALVFRFAGENVLYVNSNANAMRAQGVGALLRENHNTHICFFTKQPAKSRC